MKTNQAKSPQSIWSTPDKSQYFLIPNPQQLAAGDFAIRTATGKTSLVSYDAIKIYEISKDQSKAWLKSQLGNVMSQLKTGLKDSLFNSSSQRKENKKTEEQEKSKTPGLDLLADITNTPREHLNEDNTAVIQALKTYMTDITSTVTDAASGETDRQQSANENMQKWGETFHKHGITPNKTEEQTSDNNSDQSDVEK